MAATVRYTTAALQPALPRKQARLSDSRINPRRPEAETVVRLEALGEQLDGGNVVIRRTRVDDKPIAGTRLIREYQGVEYTVTVMTEGYEWQGRPYRSLSAIARAITGTRWNGWTFFGIRRAGARS